MNNNLNIDDNHDLLVKRLCKSGEEILNDLTPTRVHLLHMASKLCSESGELMDAIGKLCYYNKPLDLINVKEELGDIEFYLRGIRQAILMSREMILQANIDKLEKRYEGGYSDKRAQERVDKATEPSPTSPD